jgi:hypothetical protein
MRLNIDVPIPVVDGSTITKEAFRRQYLLPQKPVILRGLWQQYPAYHKWTAHYIAEKLGDLEVGLYSTKQSDPSKTMTTPTTRMRFSEYLEIIRNQTTDLRLFLFPVFRYRPELLRDFDYPDITNHYIKLPFMFFGPKGAITRMHQDIDMSNVFLTQFEGKKRVVLFPPDQSALLYKLPLNVHSIVDIDHPDFDAYPGLHFAEGMTGILEYGDTLFMPSGYWHHIEYLEGGYGLSVRTAAPTLQLRLKAIGYLTIARGIDYVANKLWGRKWFEFKKKWAVERANKEIDKILNNSGANNDHHPAFH